MTAARHRRKPRRALNALATLALCAGIAAPTGLRAGADDRLVVNPHTGLAISGVDPVAYFTDGKTRFGRPEMELSQGGSVWRFRNEGNRSAFAAHPEVYRPQFGGYDAVAIARGASVAGHPMIWTVAGGRLYLFYSEEARAAFLAEPDRVIEAATRKWPEVARSIGR